jgi:hypothetical protein
MNSNYTLGTKPILSKKNSIILRAKLVGKLGAKLF